MAAALFNHYAKGKNLRAVSAGIHAVNGDVISKHAVEALREAGIPETPDNRYSSHRAQRITEDIIAAADRVVCMTAGHALALIGGFPRHARKITALRNDISDPFGGELEDYQKCLAQILDGIKDEFPSIAADMPKDGTA